MPRFFCDYSHSYLTHDSAAGRKQQRRGWKFRENFKIFYEKYLDEWRRGPNGMCVNVEWIWILKTCVGWMVFGFLCCFENVHWLFGLTSVCGIIFFLGLAAAQQVSFMLDGVGCA